MRKIRNYCEFVIKGLNQERFFNALAKRYFVFDINRYERNKTSFKVQLNASKRVKKEILSAGFELLGQSKKGWLAQVSALKTAYGLMAGVVVSAVVFFIQMPLIWRVEISGVSDALEVEMTHYIRENFELRRGLLDCKKVEVGLRSEFEELSFTSVALEGQTLIVNAKEGQQPIEKNGEFEPIIANCDCRVIEVKLIQGTLAVETGDTLQKGSVIVYPYIIDTNGQEKKVEPRAAITIETWITETETHADNEYVIQRTGSTYEENQLLLFGKVIYSHNNEKTFENYEIEKSEKYFSNNNILPFLYRKITYYETQHILIQKSYDEVRDDKIESARKKALQKVEECDIITNERYAETIGSGIANISYTITIQKEIEIK